MSEPETAPAPDLPRLGVGLLTFEALTHLLRLPPGISVCGILLSVQPRTFGVLLSGWALPPCPDLSQVRPVTLTITPVKDSTVPGWVTTIQP